MPIVHGKLVEFLVYPTMDHIKESALSLERLDTEEEVLAAREALNHLRALVHGSKHTIGYQMSPGGLLNAYREGDIGFHEAIARLRQAYAREEDIAHALGESTKSAE